MKINIFLIELNWNIDDKPTLAPNRRQAIILNNYGLV